MRFFCCCLFLIVGLVFFAPSAHSAGPVSIVTLQSITFSSGQNGEEIITVKMSDNLKPEIFRIKGDKPRLVLDFPQALYKGKNSISLQHGVLATGIRIGVHRKPALKTRVVIDLSASQRIIYNKVFSDQDDTLTVILSSSEPEKVEQEKPPAEPMPAVVEPVAAEEPVAAAVEVAADKEETADAVASPPAVSEEEPVEEAEMPAVVHDSEPQLLEITFDDSSNKGEMVIFRLNDFYPPSVSAVEKETPRVLCDFMDMKLGGGVNKDIFANGKYVERIYTTLHKGPDKVTVTLDLAADRDYDLQQVFFKNDNLFVIIVNELAPEVAGESPPAKE